MENRGINVTPASKKPTIYVQKHLSPEGNQKIHLERASRIYIAFPGCLRGELYAGNFNAYPEGLWDPHDGYFLTMQSVTLKSAAVGTVCPRFTGCLELEIFQRGGRNTCKCLLVCGTFKDSDGSEGPCAVIYNDTDPKAQDIYKAIATHNGETNEDWLDYIRTRVILLHSSSPDKNTLSWNDVSDREVQLIQDHSVLRIRLGITVKRDRSGRAEKRRFPCVPRNLCKNMQINEVKTLRLCQCNMLFQFARTGINADAPRS